MKRSYAIIGAICIVLCVALAFFLGRDKSPAAAPQEQAPVYAYADLEHVVMSHPRYSEYHHLELEYNAMVAQYQFEQWHYSNMAAQEGQSAAAFAVTDSLGTQALDQELKAKIALKENELNNDLKQRYEKLVQEKKKTQPVISGADSLKIVNLQLKLKTLAMSKSERQATEEQLQALLRGSSADQKVTNETAEAIAAEMAPYKEKAQKELQDYATQVKAELEQRQAESRQNMLVQQQALIGNRPEPTVWNKEWKDKLDAKEKEMNLVKDDIMDDIRAKAAVVAEEQGIDVIFCDYEAVGTAIDVTDDIIAKLA